MTTSKEMNRDVWCWQTRGWLKETVPAPEPGEENGVYLRRMGFKGERAFRLGLAENHFYFDVHPAVKPEDDRFLVHVTIGDAGHDILCPDLPALLSFLDHNARSVHVNLLTLDVGRAVEMDHIAPGS